MIKVKSLAVTTNSISNSLPDTPEEHQAPAVHLSQVDALETTHRTPLQKEVPEEAKARVMEEVHGEKITPLKKSEKKTRKKKKRQERLLNFQEDLVKTCGLPPSRLMEEKIPEDPLYTLGDVRKNLKCEFDQLAELYPGPSNTGIGFTGLGTGPTMALPKVVPVSVHAPTSTTAGPVHVSFPAPAPTTVVRVHPHPLHGGRISSSIKSSTLLSSVPQPGAGGHVGEGGQGLVGWSEARSTPPGYINMPSPTQSFHEITTGPTGWSEARPEMGKMWEGMTLLPSGLPIGSTSGYPHLLALSPTPQSRVGFVQSFQTPPQPPSPSGTPAYCFHCMQYGAVFTINLV